MFLLFFQDFQSLRKHHGLGETRKVTIKKGEDEGLGLSITVSVCLLSLSNIPVYRSREEYFVKFNSLHGLHDLDTHKTQKISD